MIHVLLNKNRVRWCPYNSWIILYRCNCFIDRWNPTQCKVTGRFLLGFGVKQVMKTLRSGGMTPHILNLAARLLWLVRFAPWTLWIWSMTPPPPPPPFSGGAWGDPAGMVALATRKPSNPTKAYRTPCFCDAVLQQPAFSATSGYSSKGPTKSARRSRASVPKCGCSSPQLPSTLYRVLPCQESAD